VHPPADIQRIDLHIPMMNQRRMDVRERRIEPVCAP
jgi:hypothetical protein